jgi:PAS domain S-box-containing protein
MSEESEQTVPARKPWAALFALSTLTILAGGFGYYRSEAEHIRREKYATLAAIATMKENQLTQWKTDRLGDVWRAANGPIVIKNLAELARNPGASGLREELQKILEINLKEGLYANALLVDSAGKILLSARDEPEPLGPVTHQVIAMARASRKAVLSDFFTHGDNRVHIDAAAATRDASGLPLAVMILRSNAEAYLYPLLQSWPTPSGSAETMLVQRQGEEVVLLNELRHQTNTALSLRFPLSRSHLLAVQAVLGKQGLTEGVDYRGEDVLADLRPAPGLGGFLVTKVDAGELLAELRFRAKAPASVVLLFILLAAAASTFAYRKQQIGFLRGLYQSERQKREAQETYRTILHSIGDAVITTDTGGLVVEMNPAAETLTGWSLADSRGKPLDTVFPIVNEETREKAADPVQQVLREGVIVLLAKHTVLLSRNSAERPIADSAAPIRDEGGEVSGVVLVFRDQTAERAAHQALRESESRLTFALETTRIGAWELDLLKHTVNRTPFHDRIFGYETPLPAWTYELFLDHVLPEDRAEVDRSFNEALATRAGWNMECRIRRADGAVRWIWAAGNQQRNKEGQAVRMAGILQDITERKTREKQLQKTAEELARSNRELEQFAYISAHDLQEPLRMVTAFGSLLRDHYHGRLDATADQYIAFAVEGAERMQTLIAGLLDYSRVGKKENPMLLNAAEPLQAALSSMKSALEASGATVEAGPLPEVTADPMQLMQLFQNLIDNAIKFRGEAKPLIRISAIRLENEWQFSVQDNGIGIDPQYATRIFQVFHRLHTQEQYAGAGIGLAICKKIVESHGGRIWFESKLGAGSTFHFTLP